MNVMTEERGGTFRAIGQLLYHGTCTYSHTAFFLVHLQIKQQPVHCTIGISNSLRSSLMPLCSGQLSSRSQCMYTNHILCLGFQETNYHGVCPLPFHVFHLIISPCGCPYLFLYICNLVIMIITPLARLITCSTPFFSSYQELYLIHTESNMVKWLRMPGLMTRVVLSFPFVSFSSSSIPLFPF